MVKRAAFEDNALSALNIVSDAKKEAEAIVAQAKNDARATLLDSEALAKKEYANIIFAANTEAEQLKIKALSDVENERRSLHLELREKVITIALRANEKFFGQKEANADFIKQVMKDIKL